MRKVIERREVTATDQAIAVDLPPLLQRIYRARGVRTADELERTLERLHPATLLNGIDAAVDVLEEAVREGRRIVIVADFDADGATSCALAVRALRALGAAGVEYVVPNRFEYGYGLTPEIVAVAAAREPDVLITVDNGISSVEGVRAARARGMRVVVTDHHLPGAELPAAHAIVNPNLPDDPFPSKHLAGVGVIFYVMTALRARLRGGGWFEVRGIEEPNLARLLDLVALGTVADVVVLDSNNRVLVEQGLRRIRAGQCCAGIDALLRIAGRDRERTVAADLGFAVAPRLNAAGRLEDMTLGIECLLSDDPPAALAMAQRLDELNRDRREIESQMLEQALAAIDRLQLSEDQPDLPTGLCLFDEDWHQGVIGILAARIKERLHRPVIAFARADASTLKGSARSVPGLHIRDALDAVAARNPGLIAKFGGHAMAAGLSIEHANFDAFRAAFDLEVRRHLDREQLQGVIHSDGELDAAAFTLETAEMLRAAGPWGQGFPEPMFDGEFEVLSSRTVGERHLKLVLRQVGGPRAGIDAIAFNVSEETRACKVQRLRIAYRLDVNEYRGLRSPQLIVEYLEPVGT